MSLVCLVLYSKGMILSPCLRYRVCMGEETCDRKGEGESGLSYFVELSSVVFHRFTLCVAFLLNITTLFHIKITVPKHCNNIATAYKCYFGRLHGIYCTFNISLRSYLNIPAPNRCLRAPFLDHQVHWEFVAKKTQPCLNLLLQLSIFSQQDYKHDQHSLHVSAENIKSMFWEA